MEKALFRLVVFRVRGVWVRHQNRHRRWLRWYVLSPNNHFLNTLMSSLPERFCNINCLLVLFWSCSSTPTTEVALRIGARPLELRGYSVVIRFLSWPVGRLKNIWIRKQKIPTLDWSQLRADLHLRVIIASENGNWVIASSFQCHTHSGLARQSPKSR